MSKFLILAWILHEGCETYFCETISECKERIRSLKEDTSLLDLDIYEINRRLTEEEIEQDGRDR
jgi:hypothetical protein